jgi:cysteine desulfurase
VLYLDHHATTPVDPRVLEEMLPWFGEWFANPASVSHRFGHAAARAVEQARETLASCLGCEPEELIFTSGATEANNLAIKGVMSASGSGAHLIVNAAEHRAVLDPARRLKRAGCSVTTLPVDRCGAVEPGQLESAITSETRLASVMLANNEVGTINPVDEIGRICRERNLWLHCDAAQAFGRVPIDLRTLPVDLLSVTAHKLYGPKGVGLLFVRKSEPRIPLEPLFDGGGHEQGLRSGTLPTPLIVGFAAAARLACEAMAEEASRLCVLRDRLQELLLQRIPNLEVNGDVAHRLPNNLNVTIPGVDGDALMVRLQETDLAVSSGAACSSANPEPSHVLRAMGRTDVQARASLRFGLGRGNTRDEIERAAAVVVKTVAALRPAL